MTDASDASDAPAGPAGPPVGIASGSLVVLVGPVASGKSSWAAAHFAPAAVVSSDALRAVVGEGEHDLRASADAFALVEQIVRRRLARRLTTVIDTLGLDETQRATWHSLAEAAGAPAVAVVFDTPPAECRRRNAARAVPVPSEVLRSQFARWADVVAAVHAEPWAAVLTPEPVRVVPPTLVAPSPIPGTSVSGSSRAARPSGAPSGLSIEPPSGAGPSGARPGGAGSRGAPTESLSSTSVPTSPIVPSAAVGAAPASVRTNGHGRAFRIGLHLSSVAWPGGAAAFAAVLDRLGPELDEAGIAHVWLMDHLRQIPQVGSAWEDLPDPFTTLAYLAARTERVRLGVLVSPAFLRPPAVLAKAYATLDVLSGGRTICGLGVGWFAQECSAAGIDFPSLPRRYDALEDALDLLPRFWGKGAPSHRARLADVREALSYPRPLQAHLPIWIGGSGVRRTLPLVARHADGCNLFGEPDLVAGRIAALHAHCATEGRDPATIAISQLSTVLVGRTPGEVDELVERLRPRRVSAERFATHVNAGTVEQHAARFERFATVGVDTVIVRQADAGLPGATERLAALVERVRGRVA